MRTVYLMIYKQLTSISPDTEYFKYAESQIACNPYRIQRIAYTSMIPHHTQIFHNYHDCIVFNELFILKYTWMQFGCDIDIFWYILYILVYYTQYDKYIPFLVY